MESARPNEQIAAAILAVLPLAGFEQDEDGCCVVTTVHNGRRVRASERWYWEDCLADIVSDRKRERQSEDQR